MPERFVGGVSAKIALYKYSSFPFLLLTTMEKSLVADIVKKPHNRGILNGGILSRSILLLLHISIDRQSASRDQYSNQWTIKRVEISCPITARRTSH